MFDRLVNNELPKDFDTKFDAFLDELSSNTDSVASRKASQIVLERMTELLPEMIGGSADLTGSNNTNTKASVALSDDFWKLHLLWRARVWYECCDEWHGIAWGNNSICRNLSSVYGLRS